VLVGLLLALIGVGVTVASHHLLADRHLRRAKEALGRQRYAGAREELRQALLYRPGSAKLHLLAGRVARQMNDLKEAEQHLHRCEETQQGQNEESQLEHLMLRAQSGDIDDVLLELWPYVRDKKPQAALVLEALTNAYLRTARNPGAVECLARWLELEPDNVRALELRGVLAEREGNLILATDSYTRALELDREQRDLRLSLVSVLLSRQQFSQAVPHCNRLLKEDPNIPTPLLGLAVARRGLGELPAARECIERYLAGQPDDVEGLVEASHIALDQQRIGDAEKYLRRALRLAPHHRQVHYNLVGCLTKQGKEAEAAEHRRQFTAIEKDLREREKLRRGLYSRPHDLGLLYEMGANCLRNGLDSEGLAWLRQALDNNPRHQPTLRLLTRYYEDKGDHDRAAVYRAGVQKK
jgi:tetratricopeptide (TPR) repeat protein